MAEQNLESTYTPLNGAELLRAIKRNQGAKLDAVPGFKMGLAYHRAKVEYALIVTAHPSDCPVPQAEFSYIINAPDLESRADLAEHFGKIEVLEAKRERMIEAIELIDQILSVARPIMELHGTINAGDNPDAVRRAEGLPVPMVQTSSLTKRRSEVYVEQENVEVEA